jgi:hypothetical protein
VTLEQYASLADLVGVILIIASVVYLARQVKLSAAMMAASASAERVQRDFDLTTAVSGDREFAQIWAKGRSELDSLDEVDRIRVQMFMRRVLVHWHNMYQLRRQKLLADADWNELKWLMHFFSSQQSLRETWEVFKPSFEPSYQDFVEARFSAGDIGIANT